MVQLEQLKSNMMHQVDRTLENVNIEKKVEKVEKIKHRRFLKRGTKDQEQVGT